MGNRVARPRDVSTYDIGGRFRVRLVGGRSALASRVRDGDRLRATLHFNIPASSKTETERLRRYFASSRFVKDYLRVDPDDEVDFRGEFGLDVDAASLKGVAVHACGNARVDRAWNVVVPLALRVSSSSPFLPDVTANIASSVFWASEHAARHVQLRGVTFEIIRKKCA